MNRDEILEKIEHRKKQIAIEKHKIELCYEAIAIDPKDSLIVFVIEMVKRKSRYEINLRILESKISKITPTLPTAIAM